MYTNVYNTYMLTTFPQLLTYGLLSPLLLRVALGVIGLMGARIRWSKNQKILSGIYVLLLIGLYTQLAAIVGFFLTGLDDALDKRAGMKLSTERIVFRSFIAIVLLSLLFTGPGFFAFDLPL